MVGERSPLHGGSSFFPRRGKKGVIKDIRVLSLVRSGGNHSSWDLYVCMIDAKVSKFDIEAT